MHPYINEYPQQIKEEQREWKEENNLNKKEKNKWKKIAIVASSVMKVHTH